MRILHLSSARTFGGGERHLVDLCRGLEERGDEVFVALRPTNDWQSRLDFLPAERILHVSIRNSFGMFSAQRLGRFMADREIDVIHAHVGRDYLAAAVAARLSAGTRFVLTRHVLFPMKPFYRFALRNLDAAVGVSPPVVDELRKIFPASKVHLIFNGLDSAPLESEKERGTEFRRFHDIADDEFLIASVGELKPLKGQRDLILAAAELLKEHPRCRFLIVGVDNAAGSPFRRELKRMVSVLGMEDRFLWLDWIENLFPLLAASDLFVSPSHSESFGLAILEAMGAGLPIASTDTEGARVLIGDAAERTAPEDPVALARLMSGFAADREACSRIGAVMRERALSMFALSRTIDDYRSLYRSLKEKRGVRQPG